MKSWFQHLFEPFPENRSQKRDLLTFLAIGVFVWLFLYLLKPFGLGEYRGNLFLFCLGFGGVTFFVGLLVEWGSTYLLGIRKDLPSWTLFRWIIQTLVLIVLVAVGNYLYLALLMGWTQGSWYSFGWMAVNTFLVGVFPIIFSGMIIQLNASKRNQAQASQLHPHPVLPAEQPQAALLQLQSANQSQLLALPPVQLRFVEAMQNYVMVAYLKGETLEKEMLRNTIAHTESQLSDTNMIRCHRSFLVNLDAIESVSGNAQGLKLRLQGVPGVEIPVSRSYIPRLRELLA